MKRALLILGLGALIRVLIGVCYWYAVSSLNESADWLRIFYVGNRLLRAPDANMYHAHALLISQILDGADINLISKIHVYSRLLGLLYWLFGQSLYMGIVINSLCFFAMGLLSYHLLRQLGRGSQSALIIAAAISFWPPSLAYSSTLLKDSLCLLSLFGLAAGIFCTLQLKRDSCRQILLWGLLLVLGVVCFGLLRPRISPLVIAYLAACLLIFALWALKTRAGHRLLRGAVLTLSLILGVLVFTQQAATNEPVIKQLQEAARSAPQTTQEPVRTGQEAAPAKPGFAASALSRMVSYWDRIEGIIWSKRRSYSGHGLSVSDHAHIPPIGLKAKLAILAYGLKDALLAPYPWQTWPYHPHPQIIYIQFMVKLWMLIWYLMLPGMLYGLYRALRGLRLSAVSIAVWVLLSLGMISLIQVNVGILFRHRDLIFLPCMLLFSFKPYGLLNLLGKKEPRT